MRYRLTVQFESQSHRDAIAEAENSMEAFTSFLDHTLEVQVNEDKPDENPVFDEVEA